MNIKNKKYILLVSIILFFAAIIAITFAYINRSTVSGNSNVLVNINDDYSLVIEGSDTLSLSLNKTVLSALDANNDYSSYVDSNSANITITLTNPNYNVDTTCTFSFDYTASTTFERTPAAVTGGLNELSIVAFDGTDTYITPINDSTKKTIVMGTISASSASELVTKNYSFKMRFYNLAIDQENIVGQSPMGNITASIQGCAKE